MITNLIDIKGQKFSRLTVLEYAGKARWLCECECGNKVTSYSHNIRAGVSKECNECAKKSAQKNRFIDLTGKRFGMWQVISYDKYAKWNCKCDCGRYYKVLGKYLKFGKSKSCRFCKGVNKLLLEEGSIIGKLTTISKQYKKGSKKTPYWQCVCDCGRKEIISEYNLKNKIRTTCLSCLPKRKRVNKPGLSMLLSSYKSAAKRRNIEWMLTDLEFERLVTSNCHYTGLPPASIAKTFNAVFIYNGVDRIDSSKGYTIDNCVPCSKIVNRMKMDLPYEQFIQTCILISKFYADKKIQINNLKVV